jgi:hypothetical protein
VALNGVPDMNQLSGLAHNICQSCQDITDYAAVILYFHGINSFFDASSDEKNQVGSDKENMEVR